MSEEKKTSTSHFMTWLRAALIRALRTVAQSAAAIIGTGTVLSDVNWRMAAGASLLAGLLSLLTSVAGLPEAEGEKGQE